jgi:hypothetical protein
MSTKNKIVLILHMLLLFIFFYLCLSAFNHSNYKEFQKEKVVERKIFSENEDATEREKLIYSMNADIAKLRKQGYTNLIISVLILLSAIFYVVKYSCKKREE